MAKRTALIALLACAAVTSLHLAPAASGYSFGWAACAVPAAATVVAVVRAAEIHKLLESEFGRITQHRRDLEQVARLHHGCNLSQRGGDADDPVAEHGLQRGGQGFCAGGHLRAMV